MRAQVAHIVFCTKPSRRSHRARDHGLVRPLMPPCDRPLTLAVRKLVYRLPPARAGALFDPGNTKKRVLVVLVMSGVAALLYNTYGNASNAIVASEVSTVAEGPAETLEYKLFFTDGSKRISPWHDIPLKGAPSNTFNFVNEVPKGGRAKMEINKEAELNPIIQDTKKGKLRFYHTDSLVNYGALPQTWEDGTVDDKSTGLKGDGDPLDVLEIGEQVAAVGEVYPVKVLGALAMIDGGEADWKIIVIRASDPLASQLTDISDASVTPAAITERLVKLREWFRDYKIPDGKPANKFAFDDKYQSPVLAMDVIGNCHEHWLRLRHDKSKQGDMWVVCQESELNARQQGSDAAASASGASAASSGNLRAGDASARV